MKNASLLLSLTLACSSQDTKPTNDAGTDAAPTPMTSTAGKDIDERTPRTLGARCPLPQPYTDAIAASKLTPAQIAMPDLGLTSVVDPQRLHWTDEIRAKGDTAPSFACMVASDVEGAVAQGDSDATLRDLIAAQGMYGNRDAYVLSRYDRAYAVDASQSSAALLAALQKFYERPQLEGDASPAPPPWNTVQDDVASQVSALGPSVRVALAQAILGLIAAADLRDQALTSKGKLGFADWKTKIKTFMDGRKGGAGFAMAYDATSAMTEAMDFELLSRAGQIAARSIESLRIALAKEPTSDATLDVTGSLGRIFVSMQASDDTYSGNKFFLLVDRSGRDTYQDNIAVNTDLYHPVAVVLDLEGNDRYAPTKPIDVMSSLPIDRGQGTGQAAAWFGVALIDDAAGDDQYQAGYYQAYGLYGVGALIDHAGNDAYKGYVRSQGASDFGFGLLVDLGGGSDTYETLHNSQGFGATRGIGWLVDDGGNDSYLAVTTPIVGDPQNSPYDQEGSNFSGAQGFGWGLRAGNGTFLSGGMGALFDLGGDDKYECAVMCQAWGYFFGTGLLYDKSGNDSYTVWHKYGIGGATHQAIGVFYDAKGADKYEYVAGGIPTNGGSEGVGLGYDMSVGFHIDRGSEADTYTFDQDKQQWGEVVGISRFVGLGVFINEGGADAYHLPGKMGAYALGMTNMPTQMPAYRVAAGAQNTASVGLFFDLGGSDVYDLTGSPAANNKVWTQIAATTNSMDVFDPKLDFGQGSDSETTWAAWPAQ